MIPGNEQGGPVKLDSMWQHRLTRLVRDRYTGDLHIRWSTGCPPVDHRMSHPHASGNVPEVVHRMCRIRWTTGCAASGGPLDVCMRWTTRCVHAVDHWMCACSAVPVRGGNPMDNQM